MKLLDGEILMPIFKIWRLASKEVSIEEGSSVEEACGKAGWKSEDCEVQVIPEEQTLYPKETQKGAKCRGA